VQKFAFPPTGAANILYLDGSWNLSSEYAENLGEAGVRFDYESKDVYMAAGSVHGVELEIYRDDVFIKKITVKDEQLYTLIEGKDYGKHTLKIKIFKPGLKAFTFTFG
jgi:prepilin-type processing-associated H-X9-DG protein